MSDAEAADRGLEAVDDGKREHHPRADPLDQQDRGEPGDAGDRDPLAVEPHVGRESRRDAEREPYRCQQANQHVSLPAVGSEWMY